MKLASHMGVGIARTIYNGIEETAMHLFGNTLFYAIRACGICLHTMHSVK